METDSTQAKGGAPDEGSAPPAPVPARPESAGAGGGAPSGSGDPADAPRDLGADDTASWDTDGGAPSGGEGGEGAARPRRRRGRRGGRRHRKKPGTGGASAEAAEEAEGAERDEGAATGIAPDEGGTETAKPKTGSGAGSARARRPSGGGSARSGGGAGRPSGGSTRTSGGSARTQGGPARATVAATPAESAGEGGEAESAPEGTSAAGEGEAPAGTDTPQAGTGAPRKRRRRSRGRGRKPAAAAGEGSGEAETAGAEGEGDGEVRPPTARAVKPKAAGQPKAAGGAQKRQPKQQQKTEKEPKGKEGAKEAAPAPSTRLAARALRRESQRGQRRRPHRLTEEEAQRLRGGAKTMLVHEHDRTQIAVLEEGALIEHFVARKGARTTLVGNVFLGKVQNVLPGMEAAFVDFGRGRNGVLYAGEVDYSPEDLDGEPPRIEKILKPGQALMVQVTKDPIGTKGARLTTQISLAGRYMVLAPEQQITGISRRLADAERARLRQFLRDIAPKEHGVIIRTAAEGASKEALERDLRNLVKIWDGIQKASKKAKAPHLLYAEPELVSRVLRDIFAEDFEKVVVDSRNVYDEISGYLEETAPDLLDRLAMHEGPLPLFEEYRVTEQIHKALERKVWLPSGGSLVIDRTEAMTVIDVNTGKFTGKGSNLEETVYLNNLEAAEEVARQLRLRDIGGIIVIDFIDMIDPKHQQELLRTLKRSLSKDKTRSQVFEVSNLGLVEMTRKKVSEGLLEAFSEPCPNCEGRGIVITHEID